MIRFTRVGANGVVTVNPATRGSEFDRRQHSITDKLHADVVSVLQAVDFRESLLAQGAEPVGNSQADFNELVARELKSWGAILEGTKIE